MERKKSDRGRCTRSPRIEVEREQAALRVGNGRGFVQAWEDKVSRRPSPKQQSSAPADHSRADCARGQSSAAVIFQADKEQGFEGSSVRSRRNNTHEVFVGSPSTGARRRVGTSDL